MHKAVSLFKSKWTKLGIVLVLFTASAIIALALLLGQEAGSFVVKVSDDDFERTIRLTTNIDDTKTYTPILSVDTPNVTIKNSNGEVVDAKLASKFSDYTPSLFLFEGYKELDAYQDTLGLQYVCDAQGNCALYIYTFYVVNTSTTALSVNAKMNYSNVTNKLDECIRVMTYAKTSTTEDPNIYYKPDSIPVDYVKDHGYLDGLLEKFSDYSKADSGVVFDNQTYRISANAGSNFIKYSVFLWIEGYDPDETSDIRNGSINFDMQFDIV